MKIKNAAIAGTMESSDIMVTLEAGAGNGVEITLQSAVEKQFGKEIRRVIEQSLRELEISDARVTAVDKGALNCTIRARVKTAVLRATGQLYDWTVKSP